MYEIFVKMHFSSAHRLISYNGECSKLHGHNWEVMVYARTSKLNEIGIALDFKEFKKSVKEEIDKFDHVYLNDLEDYKDMNPTAENIARVLYNTLSKKINTDDIKIHMVEIWESEKQGARYFE
ncbi:MAG: 6-carboxytetrahydropterin synthase QueD [Candidatus Cloacimonadota bacterium]|nr:MAG: 6-carboxytetrahydropterin synthase QueD [Candidatus Cloacimonadota bacterium]PIE78108.1 MAG: 6-carboxytetrahydropterin synthase QueD [Candidatus Delongbacteria bacterium]